ncbi:MAG: FAD-dependent oxidoreductase [Elusimicrobia bacterium]|nr:FAD-dependent oxidoreductase [Elusimicrobiota bacterium]
MTRTEVLVLGAGLSGLSTAYHLQRRRGGGVLVVEKEGTVGGTAASAAKKGFVFDKTGHLLHLHSPTGRRLIGALLGRDLKTLERDAWIRLQGRYSRYPFQANTYGLPAGTVVDCLAGFLETVYRPRPKSGGGRSFAQFCLRQFGSGICRHFMFPYNRKLWGVPLSRLTAEWQGRFVPAPEPAEVLAGALLDQTKRFGYNAVFHYPRRGGSQALADALAARLEPGTVRTGAAVTSVDLAGKTARVRGLGEVRFERLVNTMPLPEFLDLSGPWPAAMRAARRRLRHVSVWCLNLALDRPDRTGRHWAYFPEPRYPFYRVGVYSNFAAANAPAGTSSYYVEVSRPGGVRFGLRALERRVLEGLRDCGVLRRGDRFLVKEWRPIPYGYVLYDFQRGPALAAIFGELGRQGVESIGRYGAWKYSFMEEALLDGKACAERLLI